MERRRRGPDGALEHDHKCNNKTSEEACLKVRLPDVDTFGSITAQPRGPANNLLPPIIHVKRSFMRRFARNGNAGWLAI